MADLSSSDPDYAGDSYSSGEEYDFSDSDDDGDGSCSCDSDEERMPAIVVREMERREESSSKGGEDLGPPGEEVVEALREHFLSGKWDSDYGGFVDCMERVGGTPSAKDRLVYLPEYNVSYIGPTGEDDPELDKELIKRHDSRVRLLRYREFIDAQATTGICIGDDWFMSTDNDLHYEGEDNLFDFEEPMTREELFACLVSFSQEFYWYANNDNLLAGIGSGVKAGSKCTVQYPYPVPRPDFTTVQIDVDDDVLHDQCRDLKKRYEELQCPLGPWMNLRATENSTTPPAPQLTKKKKKGKKGKKNRGGKRGGKKANSSSDTGSTSGSKWKPHAEEIRIRLTKLLGTMKDHLLSSDAGLSFSFSVAEMLSTAAAHDIDVARAFVDEGGSNCGSLLIDIHSRILATAKKSGKKLCWILHAMLLDVLGASIQTILERHSSPLVNELDEGLVDNPATSFFIGTMAPLLLPSVRSEIAAEREPALSFFDRVVLYVPHSPMLGLMSKKRVWGCFEVACRLGLLECNLKTDDAISSSWHNYMKHLALGTLASVFSRLCTKALALEEEIDAVTPTALAVKMVKRGVVPLLIEISKADLGYPSIKAMIGLGAISRVKDCRTIIYQDPGGLELLKYALSSPDGSMVSPALLLVLHLNWDEEWTQPLSSIEPQLQLTCVRWALFCMQRIIKRAGDAEKEGHETRFKFMRLSMDAVLTNDDEEKKRLKQLANDEKQKLGLNNKWWNVESEEHMSATSSFLGRCLLLLAALVRLENGSEKILQAGGLSLFSTCLDIPIHDTKKGCVFGLHNQLAAGNMSPSMFCDPDHYVRAIMILIHESVEAGVSAMQQMQQSLIMLAVSLRGQAEWRPHFGALPPMYEHIAEIFLDRFSMAPPHARSSGDFSDRANNADSIRLGDQVHEKNANHTGKLCSCASCGKMETKKGEMLACSKCKKASYCSKECQVGHWKVHKIDCKKWRKGNKARK